MEDLDGYYGAGDLLVSHWKMARLDAFKDQYKDFMKLEATARIMRKYQLVMPGLLQTEAYARAVLSGPQATDVNEEWVEEQVVVRMARKELLHRSPAPHIRVILDEYVLRCATQDLRVWADQLAYLIEASEYPGIVLQVLPFTAGVHDLMGSSLSLLWQDDHSAVAYVEGNKFGHLIEDPDEVMRYRLSYDRTRDLALSPSDSVTFISGILKEYRA